MEIQRARLFWKGKFALFWGLASSREADLCPKTAKAPLTISGQEAFKRGSQGCIGGGRGAIHAETAQSTLTVFLKLLMQWSAQCPLHCFKYSKSSSPESVCSYSFGASSQGVVTYVMGTVWSSCS